MLISEPSIFKPDGILSMVAALNKSSNEVKEVCEGIYEIGHFGSSDFLGNYNHYPELSISFCGVCDDYQQILDACSELLESDQQFIITITAIIKANQPKKDGWRWHKWGQYIGALEPTCEYISDEPHIDKVYVYHIYEKK